MPALTHGRVKNGNNGHSSKCGTNGQPCGGQAFNPLSKGKTYRCVAPPKTGVKKTERCPSNTGASVATKRAWERRSVKFCPKKKQTLTLTMS
jgi:hypothetical protein